MMNCSHLNSIDGIQFMPVKKNKVPLFKNWQTTVQKYDLTNCEAVGLVCGEISKNVQAIDIDLKYDLTGKLFQEYKKLVMSMNKDVLSKLTVQKTVSNGYHFIFRCSEIEGNKKLAERETTHKERLETYKKSLDEATESKEAKEISKEKDRIAFCEKIAEKSAVNDKIRVLIETRGEKGYVAVTPTEGYTLIFGDFANIQEITPNERSVLISAAQAFNEVMKEYVPVGHKEKKTYKGLSPFEHYNEEADVPSLLVKHGWKVVGHKGKKTLLLRPGATTSESSGNYDSEKRWFSVFSTSTEFESQKAYLPYSVFAVLECKGDYPEASRMLRSLGFGDSEEVIHENKISIPSSVDLTDEDYSFLATPDDYENYLEQWRKGTFQMGKSTGIPELDKYFRLKEGNLVIVNGIDNVGKSTVLWYLTMLSSMYHDWRWLIFSSENTVGSVVRKLIEFYWCEPIATMNAVKYKKAKDFVEKHFDFIKVGRELYNYTDFTNMITKAMKKKKYNGIMGDPYNSFKVDIPVKSKQQGYEYHYEAASTLQLFGKNNNLAIWLNCHVGTTGARTKDKEGFTMAPQKEDTEMGVMFANKADDFLTIHRITQHETEWNMTEIHVRKIKETETGGKVTPKTRPVRLKMVSGQTGFQHFDYNPVINWHTQGAPKTTAIDFTIPINSLEITSEQEDKPLPF